MAQPYYGEIRMFAGNFAPKDWMFCQGQLLPIALYEVLVQLIGTTYGGDGESTFALPDLRGRVPIHQGTNPANNVSYQLAQTGGVEQVTLTVQQIPVHNHPFVASTKIANQSSPTGNVVAQSSAADLYIEDIPNVNLAANSLGPTGGNQPHGNFQPYLCVNFIISLYGLFPTPT
jgi:microcystin-dependent protein